MKKMVFYKVHLRSEHKNLNNYNNEIIVTRGVIYAQEIATSEKIMICDNIIQGTCHDYYVLSSDFTLDNVAKYEEICKYLDEFDFSKFPIFTKQEEILTKKRIREYQKKNKRR